VTLDTSFHDRWLAKQMEDPEFREAYVQARMEIERMTTRPPDPGSPDAIKEGCVCDPEANRHGKGVAMVGGIPWFTFKTECPLHGKGNWRDRQLDG
jgi:hypothetical protein